MLKSGCPLQSGLGTGVLHPATPKIKCCFGRWPRVKRYPEVSGQQRGTRKRSVQAQNGKKRIVMQRLRAPKKSAHFTPYMPL